MDMPKGRCHFGEIALFYAPIYFVLGLLFIVLEKGLGPLLKYGTTPLWKPAGWFLRRWNADLDSKTHKTRSRLTLLCGGISAETLVFVVLGGYLPLNEGLLLVVVTFVGMWALPQLVIWVAEDYGPRLQPVYELGREASHALQRPTLRQVGHFMVASIKCVPAGARRSRDVGAVMLTLGHDGWRKICPLVTYVHHDGTPHLGRD